MEVQALGPQFASHFGVKDGVLVTMVIGDSPAARVGLKAGDVITHVNNEPIRSRQGLRQSLEDVKPDGDAQSGIVRDRKDSTVPVKLQSRWPPRPTGSV